MESLLDELLQKNSAVNQDKFYKEFSSLNVLDERKGNVEEIIAKVWELIQKNLISKDILYLSLLQNRNNDLLEKCISWDKSTLNLSVKGGLRNPYWLFDYTVHEKRHWFYLLFKNSDSLVKETVSHSVYDKYLYLQVICITNECGQNFNKLRLEDLIKRCTNNSGIDNFWVYYVEKIKHILRILEYFKGKNPEIKEHEFLNYASQNCLLQVGSEYLDLCNDHSYLDALFTELDSSSVPHEEDFSVQRKILTSYSVLAEFLKLIIPHNHKCMNINVNDIIVEIQAKFLSINDHSLQIELLKFMFASIFIKYGDIRINNAPESFDKYICNQKEVQIILFALKSLIEEIKFKKIYEGDLKNTLELDELHRAVTDANWRLELIVNLVSASKCEENLLHYMLAEPESLIKLCLKNNDFNRASQVLQIFGLESTSLAREIMCTEHLQELKETLKRTVKIREIQQKTPEVAAPTGKLQFDDVVEEFFLKHPITSCEDTDVLIRENMELYPFLEHYKSDNELMMNILDLALTQTETFDDSRALLHLALKYNTLSDRESDFSSFSRKLLILFNEIAENQSLTLSNILLDPSLLLDFDMYKKEDQFYTKLQEMYTEFSKSLMVDEEGVLNKDHPSHKLFQSIQKHCSDYFESTSSKSDESVKYLQKLFNYLKAFSKVLYIQKDSSELVSGGMNTTYFELLAHNRSELTGKLLFQENLDPMEFEKYFSKLKLDFLYHVAGNCFPTINLHTEENVSQEELYHENRLYPPNKAIITYISNTNRLLALLLIEMYKIEDVEVQVGESRLQYFINYLRLPKIDNLQALYKYNEIITALQNEISFQKLHNFIHAEIGKHEFTSSTHTSHSSHSLDTAEEIGEDELKTTNWRKLFNIIDSVPENQFKKGQDFVALRDMVLVHLVNDAFECEYYKFTYFISDRRVRVNLLLENMKAWPEDFCINSIKSEISRFDREDDAVVDELKVWLKHIEHSKKVMSVLGVTTWASMYDMCAFQPKEVLHKLLSSQKVDLLLEFIELHEVSEVMLLTIDENFLETAFNMGTEIRSIKRLLKFLPHEHAIKLCQNLLGILKNVTHLQFITDYLIKHTNDHSLGNVALSLKMLSVFTHEFDQQLLFLLRDPLSIIEVLVMNTKLDKLAAVLEVIKPSIPVTELNDEPITVDKIDDLLRRYAEKSLDFRVIAQPEPRLLSTPDHKLLQSLDSINLDPEAKVFVMPEEVPTKDQWVKNTEVIECMGCKNVFFSMFNRRHHCRRCGRVICSSCSKNRMIVPTYGNFLVRVCSDCYKQTYKDLAMTEDTTSTKSALADYWMLTNDPEHNRIVREEFSYEFAPSVSLCLSLMKFHSTCDEYSKFLLDQCDVLLKLLIPNQEPLQEIDYMLVIRMLKSLALAAKMVSQDTSLQYGSSSADRILSQAELLELLAERGCLNLLPNSGNSAFIDHISLMRLTDKLLEKEQWGLALEVSTKAGIDKSGVFVAWGKSCLKAGSLALAREKFSKCLDKNAHHDPSYYDIDSSSLKVIKNPPLLNEIIKILESKKGPIDAEVISDHQKFLGSTLTLNQSITSSSQSDAAIFVLNKLRNLKNIENGYYSVRKPNKQESNKCKLEDIIYDECVYYLNKYGTGISLVEFHIKYGHFKRALDCIIKKRLSPEVFVDVYMKCLKDGSVKTLQAHMSEIDSTLSIWKDHLMQICSHLEKHKLLHSLYQLQQYMGDYVRAAMTCVRFYEEKAISFTDLLNNGEFLTNSQEHLSQAKEQEQWIALSAVRTVESEETFEETNVASPLIKKMTNEDIEKHTATIAMQIEVTKFLANCEKNGVMPMHVFLDMFPNTENIPKHKITIPTLFGSAEQRKYLAVLCMICGETVEQGFELGLRIMNEFKLKPITVYKEAGKYLAHTEKVNEIRDLVCCIKQYSGVKDALVNEVCDEMLLVAVATIKNASASDDNVEELIKLISDKAVKISAYIESNKLNIAYCLAMKYKRLAELKKIMRSAELSNQPAIKVLCQRAIQKCTQSSPSSTSGDN